MNKIQLLLAILMLTTISIGQTQTQNEFIETYSKKHNFSGTILIQKEKKRTYQKSFGYANIPFKVSNNTNTKYKIASITKAFTSVLILQLVEAGKLDLHKPIKTYLPNYTGEAGDKVTIHQLLNHTSGIANIDRNVASAENAVKNGIPHYQTPLTTDELLSKYCSEKLVNIPGKVFDYNNADYIILGKIIEKSYDKRFEEVLSEKILKPLGMLNSGMLYQSQITETLAETYFSLNDSKTLRNDLPVYIENWFAAGAMYSTVTDLLKFSKALFGSKLLKKETLELMFTSGLDEYGYGVWVYNNYNIRGKNFKIIKRPGSIMGSQTMLFHILEANTTIIILSNSATVDLDSFVAEIAKLS